MGRGAATAIAVLLAGAVRPAEAAQGLAWDTENRTAVAVAFARHYLPGEDAAEQVGWNGDVDQCVAGSPDQDFLDATMTRINYFRAQAGVAADVEGEAALDQKCQKAALVMSREGETSHFPLTDFPSNPCLSADAATAAAKANLLLDWYGPPAIDRFMTDAGAGNRYAGHRRWLLYPRQQRIGNGALPAGQGYRGSHCSYVIGTFKPAPPAAPVAWPNEGFVPWQLVPNDGDAPARWTFSYAGAGFASAGVTVERLGPGGGMLEVTKEQVGAGYGDNTLVWQIEGIPDAAPEDDTTYRVTVSGVTAASHSTFVYDVTVIDPFRLGVDVQPRGPQHPEIGVDSQYEFDPVAGVDGYDVRVARAGSGDWLEGAEDAGSEHVVDGTSGGYDLRSSAVKASGQKSFHLAAPGLDEPEQSFTIDRIIVPSAASTLRFRQMRRCASSTSAISAQISSDGRSWETLWSRTGIAGVVCLAANWDPGFTDVSVPVPQEYEGTTVQVRFVYRIAGPLVFTGTGSSTGFYVDDVEVTDSQELVSATQAELPADATAFSLVPQDTAELWLQVRPRVGAVRYAYGTPAVVMPAEQTAECGDGNGDGNVTASDALLALKTAVGAAGCSMQVCDANDSGGITATDALLILKHAVGGTVPLDCPG